VRRLSNLVWTAGHCVHADGSGGWYRNIAFVPAYNDQAAVRRSVTRWSKKARSPARGAGRRA
jgi:V8-like Glu-specific endopeptidase